MAAASASLLAFFPLPQCERFHPKPADDPPKLSNSTEKVRSPQAAPEVDEFQNALATLLWREDLTARSLFDHVSAMIRQIYTTQGKPEKWSNKLELLSRLVKRCNVPPVAIHHIKPGYVNPPELTTYQRIRDLFAVFDEEEHTQMKHNGPTPPGIGYVPPNQPVEEFPPVPAVGDGGDEAGVENGEPKVAYKPIDMYEWLFYSQEAALGLTQTETYLIMTALLRFEKVNFHDLEKLRFWGKIQGSQQPYYVVECQFKELSGKWFDLPASVGPNHSELTAHKATVYNPFGTYGWREDFDETFFTLNLAKFPIPNAPTIDPDQRFKEVMPEESGNGANMYCYYVCTDLIAAEWQRLPDVTPEQIRKARFIRRALTGILSTKVVTCPSFPGTEQNYLRAQIARISHNTTIGPLGQYAPLDEDEEPEEGMGSPNFRLIENPEFEHPNQRDILSKNLGGYAHNLPFMLRQGRCSWYDPSPGSLPVGDEENEEEEREEEGPEEGAEEEEIEEKIVKKKLIAKPESGPAVFSPITDDREIAKDTPAWTAKATNTYLPQNGLVKICSNLWPGAVCLVQNDKSENVYVGDGVTKSTEFAPFMPPLPQTVFNQNLKSLLHRPDPDPALEKEQRVKREAAAKAKLEAEQAAKEEAENSEEEGEEGEGEEEEETEDEK